MTEHLAPGLFVEKLPGSDKAIEGVSTSVAAFIGPTRYGPLDTARCQISNLQDFECEYGGGEPLQFAGGTQDNYIWHAVRAFFAEGGRRLYVSRVYKPLLGNDGRAFRKGNNDGRATNDGRLDVRARYPGIAGNCNVTLTLELGSNCLVEVEGGPELQGVGDRDVVLIELEEEATSGTGGFYLAVANALGQSLTFEGHSSGADLSWADVLNQGRNVHVVTASVTVQPETIGAQPFVWEGLPIDPLHSGESGPDSLFALFAEEPATPSAERDTPVVISFDDAGAPIDGLAVLRALTEGAGEEPQISLDALEDGGTAAAARSVTFLLREGDDGELPDSQHYAGLSDAGEGRKGLQVFEDIADISIVAAPGASVAGDDEAKAVTGHLISHAEKMRCRIAIVDSGKSQSISEVRALRAMFDSSYAAFYYPWITIIDPVTGQRSQQPPSGFVAGIYARNDIERSVYKAPANEVVRLAIGFETNINRAQQEILNPEGVNCFRFFEGRGMRIWGARTMSHDPEYKYVSLRRYLAYLQRSIEVGMEWVMSEESGEQLWSKVRSKISDFLQVEWSNGGLLGDKPEKAFFVKCDRSTMSQSDMDAGILQCLIGVAMLKPAEFVILRIKQQTAVS
jgi:phage tail sheath protein FI